MKTEDQQNAEAVEALAPLTRTITGAGKQYEVKRLETRQIWPTLRAGLPIIEGLVGLVGPATASPAADSPLGSSPQGGQPPVSSTTATDDQASNLTKLVGPEVTGFLQMMAEHGEKITEIVAIGLDEKVSTVGRFEPHETYFALKALIEVNRDFFTQRVAPLLGLAPGQPVAGALAGAVGQALRTIGDGPTPSSN